YRQTDIHSPIVLAPVPVTSAPTAAHRFYRLSNCRPGPGRGGRARAAHRHEPMLGPHRVSLSALGVWLSPENFSTTPADTNAAVLFRGGPRRDPAVPAIKQKTPESDPALLRVP